jgi:hypothetical protein
MRPAFSSTRQAAGFGLLVAVMLSLPALLPKGALGSHEEMYASYGWGSAAYPYIQDQIYRHPEPIDILFVGSSHMNSGIDPAYVQQKLSEHLGHPATVVSLCWGGPGFDITYLITRELLKRRKVGMIVFYDDLGLEAPSWQAWKFLDWADLRTALAGLPWHERAAYYYGGIFSLPRSIFNRLVPTQAVDRSETAGRVVQSMEFHPPDAWLGLPPVTPGQGDVRGMATPEPTPEPTPAQVLIYGSTSASHFDFFKPPAQPLQVYFAQKFLELARQNGSSLVCLSIPVLEDRHDAAVPDGRLWLQVFQKDAALVGIPPAELFAGLNDAQVQSFYRNPTHLNAGGEELFTKTVTPRLLELYDKAKP